MPLAWVYVLVLSSLWMHDLSVYSCNGVHQKPNPIDSFSQLILNPTSESNQKICYHIESY